MKLAEFCEVHSQNNVDMLQCIIAEAISNIPIGQFNFPSYAELGAMMPGMRYGWI